MVLQNPQTDPIANSLIPQCSITDAGGIPLSSLEAEHLSCTRVSPTVSPTSAFLFLLYPISLSPFFL